MFATILIPEFPLQALLRGHAQTRPCAVVDDALSPAKKKAGGRSGKAPVIALNAQAAVAGVQLGMTAPQAQARCGGLRVVTRDRVEETEVYRSLLAGVESWCADVEATAPGVVTVDFFGCRQWHSDWKRFGEALCQDLSRELRLEVVMGLAPTPDLARLAAASLAGDGPVVRLLENSALDGLSDHSIRWLSPPPALYEVLELWGIERIGAFLSLSRDEVGGRLGEEAAALWDMASGKRKRLLRLVRPPDVYEHTSDFDYEIEQLDPLLFVIRRGLEALTTRLATQYRVTAQVDVSLRFANGTELKEVFRVPDPTNEVELLYRVVQRRLETLEAKSAITGMTVRLHPVAPKKRQFDFFQETLKDPNRFGQTLAELEALLGSERVGRPRSGDTHRPDVVDLERFDRAMEAVQGGTASWEDAASEEGDLPLGLPLRRCRPPLRVSVRTERREGTATPVQVVDGPCRGGIVATRGPWKASGDWWDASPWAREEWDVELSGGRLCQLVRIDQEWFFEGIYG
jgi:protein ImuB